MFQRRVRRAAYREYKKMVNKTKNTHKYSLYFFVIFAVKLLSTRHLQVSTQTTAFLGLTPATHPRGSSPNTCLRSPGRHPDQMSSLPGASLRLSFSPRYHFWEPEWFLFYFAPQSWRQNSSEQLPCPRTDSRPNTHTHLH